MKFGKSISCTVLILIITFPIVVPSFNEKEAAIVSNLVKEMDIRFCIFWVDDTDIHQIKRLSTENIRSSQLNTQRFLHYFHSMPYYHDDKVFIYRPEDFSTAIIFKTKTLNKFERLTEEIEEKYQSFRLSWFTWFLFLDNSKPNLVYHYDKRIPYDCEFIVIQEFQDSLYQLTEVYAAKNKTFTFDFGTWYNGVLSIANASSYWRRLNLNQTLVTTFGFLENQNACNRRFNEYCQFEILLQDLSKMMNFRLNKIVVPISFVSKNLQDILRSLMNMNRNLVIDMIITTAVYYNTGMMEVFRLGPIFTYKYNWYIKYPEARLRQDYYLQPFVPDLWLSIFLILVIGCASALFIQNLVKSNKLHLVDHFFLVFEIFCNQSGSGEIENISLRILCFAISTTAIAVFNSFTSVITAFLAVKIPEIPFTNFDEFIENGQYKLAIESSFLATYLSETKYAAKMDNYTLKYDNDYYNLKHGTILCNNENIAIYAPDYKFEYENVSCRTYRIAQPITSGHLVLQLTFHNPFTSIFNHNLIRFREYGILKKMQDIVHSQPIKNKEEENFTPIEIEQMIQVLSIPIFGMLLAAVIFACEFICTRKKLWITAKRNKKTNPPVLLQLLFFKRSQSKQ